MYKMIKEWEEIFELDILDPDGFDRTKKDLYCMCFTKEEFERGLLKSTIQFKCDLEDNPVIQVYKVDNENCGWCAYDNIDNALEHYKANILEGDLETVIYVDFMRKKTYDTLPEFEG